MPPTRRATPQDHKKPGDEALFVWTASDGTTIRLPRMSSLGTGAFRRNRNKGELDMVFSVLEEVMTAPELAALDRLPLAETNKLFAAWMADAEVSVPQS